MLALRNDSVGAISSFRQTSAFVFVNLTTTTKKKKWKKLLLFNFLCTKIKTVQSHHIHVINLWLFHKCHFCNGVLDIIFAHQLSFLRKFVLQMFCTPKIGRNWNWLLKQLLTNNLSIFIFFVYTIHKMVLQIIEV